MKAFLLSSVTLLQLGGALAQFWSPPSAAIHWNGFDHIRVYAVDPQGQIREWQWENNGRWTGPSYIGAQARPGTTCTATNDNSRLRVYFQTPSGSAAEWVYENGWRRGATLP